MNTLDTMFAMRHKALRVPVVVFVPELGVSLEVSSVREIEGAAYMSAAGEVCRGTVVMLEVAAQRETPPDPLPDC